MKERKILFLFEVTPLSFSFKLYSSFVFSFCPLLFFWRFRTGRREKRREGFILQGEKRRERKRWYRLSCSLDVYKLFKEGDKDRWLGRNELVIL